MYIYLLTISYCLLLCRHDRSHAVDWWQEKWMTSLCLVISSLYEILRNTPRLYTCKEEDTLKIPICSFFWCSFHHKRGRNHLTFASIIRKLIISTYVVRLLATINIKVHTEPNSPKPSPWKTTASHFSRKFSVLSISIYK